MVRPFQLVSAARIVFGRGSLADLGSLAAELGRRALVVTNADRSGVRGLHQRLGQHLAAADVEAATYWVRGEPEIADVDRGLEAARSFEADLVIGVGGGSALDAAKAIAGLLANGGACLDYMEVIGEGRPILRPALPWIAMPTTAGTGAEVTRNAVIGSKEQRYKASIRSPLLLPRIALVDPELALGVPPEVTARTGMDALTQCIESYTSNGANPLTDPLALDGIVRAGRSLQRAVQAGDDLDAREDMALVALISGITLTNAGLGAVHGLAAPLGARFPVPHGTVCAVLLPHVLRTNVARLRATDVTHPTLGRYAAVGRALTGNGELSDEAAVDTGIARTAELVRQLGLPGLGSFGVRDGEIRGVVEMARKASSMRFNPVELPESALCEILQRAL